MNFARAKFKPISAIPSRFFKRQAPSRPPLPKPNPIRFRYYFDYDAPPAFFFAEVVLY